MSGRKMSFEDTLSADRRLVILRALQQDPGFDLNAAVLLGVLESFGHRISHDRLRADLEWLAEQGYCTLQAVATIQVARITDRGADVALGRTVVHGVRRPAPGE